LTALFADFAGLQPRMTYTVEPVGEGTRFTRGVEMRPSGLKMLMSPLIAFMVPCHNKALSRISSAYLDPEGVGPKERRPGARPVTFDWSDAVEGTRVFSSPSGCCA